MQNNTDEISTASESTIRLAQKKKAGFAKVLDRQFN